LADEALLTKRETFERSLAECYEVVVTLIPTPHIELPAGAWRQGPTPDCLSTLFSVLIYGLDLPQPLSDLDVTDEGIRATLSFRGKRSPTFVPWASVIGIIGKGQRPKQGAQLRSV
jgi:hypothetical protein